MSLWETGLGDCATSKDWNGRVSPNPGLQVFERKDPSLHSGTARNHKAAPAEAHGHRERRNKCLFRGPTFPETKLGARGGR